MGKSDIHMKRWLSNKERFSDLINGALFGGKKVFSAEGLNLEENEESQIVSNSKGKKKPIDKYRDIKMTSEEGVRIVMLASENQQKVNYAMVVRIMQYDSLEYSEQIRRKRKEWGEDYIPNYRINIIDPSKFQDLSCFNRDLQMVFGMLKYRKDKKMLKQYVEENKEFFSHIDDETFDAIAALLGSEKILNNFKSEEREGEYNLCKAIDDIYQDGVIEGKAEAVLELLEELGNVSEQLRKLVNSQKDLVVLKQWHLQAARSSSIGEFETVVEGIDCE